jgi:DNA mismatch endonuclease (patch repair protein)
VGDVFTKAKRSEVMSRIRGRDNKDTEVAFILLLRKHQVTGWRRHRRILLSGKSGRQRDVVDARRSSVRPDFVFVSVKLAVFIDGCFWHGCPRHCTYPTGNQEFWQNKLENNRKRDRYTTRMLRRKGWKVLRVWEHELRAGQRVAARLKKSLAGH